MNSNSMTNSRVYERHISYTTKIKFLKNNYTILIIIEFDTNESEFTINLAYEYRKSFTTIKLVNPSASIITNNDATIKCLYESLMNVDYINIFRVNNDKKS